ncbi:hypothetical protein FXO37_26389 [Capsicum annuum]|nr:hypothetical protein FXO37_26389 [Capsicum annuum]
MKNENIDGFFKKSCFGCFLDLPEDRSHFPMMMVYGLLKHKIKYVGDDEDPKEGGKKKMDEIWINYCGMPVCFGLQEFAIVMGLRCHRPKEPPPQKRSKAIKQKAWAFEVIPPLQKQVMHIWILPTEEESVMTSYITLGHVDTIEDPMVELIKKELARETAIRRAVRQDPGSSSSGVVGVGGRHADAANTHDDEHIDAQEEINMFENGPFHPCTGPSHPSSPSCSGCECEECKDSQDKLFEKVEAISKDIKEFKSKRCVIPSKKAREPQTPTVLVKRKKKAIRDVLSG